MEFGTTTGSEVRSMSKHSDRSAEILAVGDIFLDRENPKSGFKHVKDRFDKADIVVGNQEAALSDSGEPAKFYPWMNFLYSPPSMVEGLAYAGFDVLGLANNQSMNYGPGGLLDTIELLDQQGIEVAGAGGNSQEAKRPASTSANGVDIGVLAYEATKWDWKGSQAGEGKPGLNQIAISPYFPEPHVSEIDVAEMEDSIEQATEEHDVVIVYFHFGIAGEQQVTMNQRALAHSAVDAGADVIIGAHPHTLQPIEIYNSKPIFYSLGNFIFDRPDTWSLELMDKETIVVSLECGPDGVSDILVYPAVCDYGARNKPKILNSGDEQYEEIVDFLQKWSDETDMEDTGEYVRIQR